jgi:hypothetical protein
MFKRRGRNGSGWPTTVISIVMMERTIYNILRISLRHIRNRYGLKGRRGEAGPGRYTFIDSFNSYIVEVSYPKVYCEWELRSIVLWQATKRSRSFQMVVHVHWSMGEPGIRRCTRKNISNTLHGWRNFLHQEAQERHIVARRHQLTRYDYMEM